MLQQKYTSFREIPQLISDGSWACDFSYQYLLDWIQREELESGLNLEPDFQRGHVWTREQQISYMEFLLRGGKSGRDLYFNSPSFHNPVPDGAYDEFVCVDGLQRLTAIKAFFANEIPVFGSYFKEYMDSPRLSTNTIRLHVNDLKTKAEVLEWYLQMNGGGTPHSQEELDRVQEMLNQEKR